jgi:glycosyltransferase involved in cell wall biosynthesis
VADDLQVLLWNPCASPFGGHVVQMEMTAKFLSQLGGISVRTCRSESPDWDGLDIVHGFELEAQHVREARRRRIPVCISVIYWSKQYRTGLLRQTSPWQTLRGRARMVGVLSLAAAKGRHVAKSEALAKFAIQTTSLYESADLLLPNSELEAAQIVRDLEVTTPMRVVPNGVDPAKFRAGLPWDQRQGVLYVGRLEPHKNQLGLIYALRGTGVPLTIVGGGHPHHPEYLAAVKAEAGENVRVVGQTPHGQLADYYASARVHVLPSRFETTGLVSLEAAVSGCNVVTTEVGYAREYFKDMAWYCNPGDPDSIRSAVFAALAAPPQDLLRERILQHYTWEHTAEATAAAYRDVLARR